METKSNFDDFVLKDDGFREIVEDSVPNDTTLDADPAEKVDSNKVANIGSVRVIICPQGSVIAEDLGLKLVECENLADVGYSIKTIEEPFCMSFTDIKILREFIRKSGLFGVRIAAFDSIPGSKPDRLYEQSVWALPRLMYEQLLNNVKEHNDSVLAAERRDKAVSRTKQSFYRGPNPVKGHAIEVDTASAEGHTADDETDVED